MTYLTSTFVQRNRPTRVRRVATQSYSVVTEMQRGRPAGRDP
jgi:hypothetical protein